MFKKTMLLAMAAAAVLAVAAPAASANWYHSNNPLSLGDNPKVLFTGTAQFSGGIGTVHCEQATATIQLTGGTDAAHLLSFTADEPTAKCKVTSGLIKSLCGEKSVEEVKLLKTAKGTINGDNIDFTEIELFNKFGNICLELVLKNKTNTSITATPAAGTANAIKTVTLSGTLVTGSNEVAVTGDLTSAGTYGTT